MYQVLFRDASFWSFLFDVDQDLAARSRKQGCSCGGLLHCANYPRKPRGGCEKLPESYRFRLSFCCDREGCRKRATPPSVRFLGRKVYLGAVVVLVAAMQQGPTPRRVRELSELFDVDRCTIGRWRAFWREHFPKTVFWKVARSRLIPIADVAELPWGLVQAFLHSGCAKQGWKRLLEFLSPITIRGGLLIKGPS